MPQVYTKKKSKAGAEYSCARCPNKIVAGQEYHEWSFRYGGTHRQHASHGRPKDSQLTQSKMSQAHAACEALEEVIAGAGCIEDMTSGIEECISGIEEVRDEYESAIEAMPASEEANRERIDMLENFIGELESARDDIEGMEPEEPEEPGDDLSDEDREAFIDNAKEEAEQAMIEEARSRVDEALGSKEF